MLPTEIKPILVNGVLRLGGRFDKALANFSVWHSVILPSDSHFTELLILHHHQLVGHSGVGHTWASLQQSYWIVKGSVTVQREIGNCVFSKKQNAPVSQQLMADLPLGRLQVNEPPFSYARIDYFEPFLAKQGRSQVKRYGCIFTCLSMHAVHLEVAHNLTTDSFLQALRRFISCRGKPQQIYSDNSTNFVGAEKILRDLLQL